MVIGATGATMPVVSIVGLADATRANPYRREVRTVTSISFGSARFGRPFVICLGEQRDARSTSRWSLNSKSLLIAAWVLSCSQMCSGSHPAWRSLSSFRRSRATLPSSFVRHQSALFFGKTQCWGQACQKQPSTNTATRGPTRTMSGLPGRSVRWSRYRIPEACRARRTATSGSVDFVGILLIWAETTTLSGGGVVPIRPGSDRTPLGGVGGTRRDPSRRHPM